ncbi:hypothetical protein CGLO_13285 [Colletotrichum gloeosporioides Cg-14]|uniref:Uncharacterized protein n=1 Tax=Colletotrichum gloeosporioides (strain Cg-14) TaxID=1237896 RepID=T0L7F7_COLGC|nr:hypothetical protein CGLO_13285 [Colletotrichum gloeosporioides Cg-14]
MTPDLSNVVRVALAYQRVA